MGFREKIAKYYSDSYLRKYGDRITQVQGNVISVKIEEKTILWIFHKLIATLIVKQDRSKTVVKCVYSKNKWFKKPTFMTLNQGHLVIVQGLKAKKDSAVKDSIEILNIKNLTTKRDLVYVDGAPEVKKVQKIQRIK